jgi:hypothetical protein
MIHDIETRSVELAEVRAGIKLHAGHRVVLVVSGGKGTKRYLGRARARDEDGSSDADRSGGASEQADVVKDQASLVILGADGAAGHAPDKLRIGAGNGLQLKWIVLAGASSAKLSAKSLVQKHCEASDKPATAGHASNDQLLSSGVDLPLGQDGYGSGVVLVEPGPCGSTEYIIAVARKDNSTVPPEVRATAFVANFNVQLELPDGSDYARNKSCVLEIPGQDAVRGTTNEQGELWLWLPNVSAENATLRLLDGGRELASWTVGITPEEGVPSGALALNDAHPAAAEADRLA